MKMGRIFLISFFICVFLWVSVSFSQTTSIKVQNFLKVIQAATSLAEVRTALDKAKFTQSEFDQLKKAITSSPTLTQKINQLVSQARALMKPKMDQLEQAALANLEAMKTKYVASLQQKAAMTQAQIQENIKNIIATACVSDSPIIESVSGAPIMPGVSFAVHGKGFGKGPGSIDLMVEGFVYRAIINRWDECYVWASLTPEISGLRASNYATLVLRTAGGRETNKVTSFQPLLEFTYLYDWDEFNFTSGGSNDYILNNYQLKNDWFVSSRNFKYFVDSSTGGSGHAEITYASDLNVPNGSARTNVHAGCSWLAIVDWGLHTYIFGPKGLAYK